MIHSEIIILKVNHFVSLFRKIMICSSLFLLQKKVVHIVFRFSGVILKYVIFIDFLINNLFLSVEAKPIRMC